MEDRHNTVTEYLGEKSARFERLGFIYNIHWDTEPTVFRDGWVLDVREDDFTGWTVLDLTYSIRGVEDDALAEAKWQEIRDKHPDVSFSGRSTVKMLDGEVQLSRGDVVSDLDGDIEGCLDKSFQVLAEAVFSLMARYEQEYLQEEETYSSYGSRYSGFAKRGFLSRCIQNSKTAVEEAQKPQRQMLFELEDEDLSPFSDLEAAALRESQKRFVFIKPAARHDGASGRMPTGFAAIAGMDQLKNELGRKVLWPLSHKGEARKYRLHMPSGMLLYGPPGCGKTFFAEKFAEECGYEFTLVTPSDLGSKYLHGSQGLISRLFAEANRHIPCVICLDEIDAMIPSRDMMNGEYRADEVNEFLAMLNNAGYKGIFVIGTTNRKDMIDQAALRSGRFDLQVEISAPDAEMRVSLFRHELNGRPLEDGIDLQVLSAKTDGYACSDIVKIVNDAALEAAVADEPISQKRLEKAADATGSSIRDVNRKSHIGFGIEVRKPLAIGS